MISETRYTLFNKLKKDYLAIRKFKSSIINSG